MVFSDTTTKLGLIQDCEFLINAGDGGISGNSVLLAQFVRNINAWLHKATTLILNSQDDWEFDDLNNTSNFPVGTTPMVAGQRAYVLPASLKVLKVQRVDLTYDGSTYYRATPFDTGSTGISMGNDTKTDQFFNLTEPRYDLLGNSIWIYPAPTAAQVAAGGLVRLEFLREASEFTASDTTKEPGLDEPFHRLLSLGASLDYAMAKNMPIAPNLGTMVQDYEQRLLTYYGKKNNDTMYFLAPNLPSYE